MSDQVKADAYFAIVPEWVLFADVSANAIRLYAVLTRYADKGAGTAHPSRKTLAEKARCSIRTIDNAVAELIEIGAISRTYRRTESGDLTSNLWTVHRVAKSAYGDAKNATTPRAKNATTVVQKTPHKQKSLNESQFNDIDDDAKKELNLPMDSIESSALDILARKTLAAKSDVKNPRSFLHVVKENQLTDGTADRVHEIHVADVTLSPQDIAETVLTYVPEASMTPADRQVQAASQLRDRHENPCPACDGTTWSGNEAGELIKCPECNGTGVAA